MINFDAKTHTYTIDKRVIPSVTQVISTILTNPIDNSNEVIKNAAQRGSLIHSITAKIDLKLSTFEITKDIENYIIAYSNFLKDFKPRWDYVEHKLYNKELCYAGTCDRIGFFTGFHAIVDIKTGSIPKWAGIQLAAYREAHKPRVLTHRRFVLHLCPDAKYKLIKYSDPMDWRIFQAALTCYNWRLNNE